MIFTPLIAADLMIVVLLGLLVWHLRLQVRRRRFMLLDPLMMFWAGILVCNVYEPFQDGVTYLSWHGDAVFLKSLALVILGCTFVVIGYDGPIGVRLGNLLPPFSRGRRIRGISVLGISSLVIATVGYVLQWRTSGGLREWLQVGRGATDYEALSGYSASLIHFLPLGVFLLFFYSNTRPVSRSYRLLTAALVCFTLYWHLYLGTRSRLILLATLLLAAYYLPKRKSPSTLLSIGLFLAMFLATRAQMYLRENFTDLSLNLTNVDSIDALDILTPWKEPKGELASFVSPGSEFNVLLTTVELVPSRVDYNYAYGLLELFTRPIPKSVWPSKPYPGLEAVQGVLREGRLSQWGPATTDMLSGPAFPFAAYWYYALGIIGVILGAIATGILLRTIRQIHDRDPGTEGNLLVYALLLNVGFAEAASTPLAWVYVIPITLVPLVVALRFLGTWDEIH